MDVPSIDEALQTVERLGGSTVVAKQPVGGMGWGRGSSARMRLTLRTTAKGRP